MSGIVLTAYSGAILGPIAKFLGMIMNLIYMGLSAIGINSLVLSIVLMTIVIYMCLLPLTIKQQKFSKLSQKMQPEIQAIQDKYKGKRDQASMAAMQQETSLVYQKYGVSPSGTCVQLLIQMPILLALYRVFYNIPAYLPNIKNSFSGLTNGIVGTSGFEKTLVKLLNDFSFTTSSGIKADNIVDKFSKASNSEIKNYVIDVLYKLPSTGWESLNDYFPDLADKISSTQKSIEGFNYFVGLNISDTPWNIITTNFQNHSYLLVVLALLIPICSLLSQFANIKLMPQPAGGNDQMAQQMKTMNLMMPLMSFIICFTVPVGLGIYWICSALVRVVQQYFINRHIENLDLDDIIRKNEEKAKAKREKMGIYENQIRNNAHMSTRSLNNKANAYTSAQKELELEKARALKANVKKDSLASKANKVKEFNESNSR